MHKSTNQETSNDAFYPIFKKNLKLVEQIWNVKQVNPQYAAEFAKMKEHNHFTSLMEIEAAASAILQKNFSFNALLESCKVVDRNDVKSAILDLYNFLINSHIFPKEILLKLLYPLTLKEVNQQFDNEIVAAYAFSAYGKIPFIKKSAMIGANFIPQWSHQWQFTFTSGQTSSANSGHNFIHEMAHTISFFYNLNPDFSSVLNKNITDLNKDEDIMEKINYHFFKNFDMFWKVTGDTKLVKQAIDYVTKTMVSPDNQTNEVWNTVAKLIAVPSSYGRTLMQNRDANIAHPENEWFAEGFTYYFLTPPADREKFWNIWHEFFTTQINQKQIF